MDSPQLVSEAGLSPSTRVFQGPVNTLSSEVQRAPPKRRVPFSIEDIMKSADTTPLTRPEVSNDAVKVTAKPEGFGCPKREHLPRYQIPESLQTSKIDGKLDHPQVDSLYLQNEFEKCEVPAFPLCLHHLHSIPERRLPLQPCTDSPQANIPSFIPSPSHLELDVMSWKTSMLQTSSESYDEGTDVESASPNGSTASSGYYSNSSPTHSSDSSPISGRTFPGTHDDRVPTKRREEDNVSTGTASITQEEDISEKSSTNTQEEDCVSANPRKNYSGKQVRRLKQVFLENKYPDVEVYEDLSQELNIPVKRLKVWFQNRRARNKRTSDTKMINYPLQQPNMAAMLSSAPGYPYMPPMMHQPMYQYPAPHVPMMYPPNLYPGYPYPFHYQQ